jgi:hypothetical protein
MFRMVNTAQLCSGPASGTAAAPLATAPRAPRIFDEPTSG